MIPREMRRDEDEKNSEVILPSIFGGFFSPLKSDIPNGKPFASKMMLLYD